MSKKNTPFSVLKSLRNDLKTNRQFNKSNPSEDNMAVTPIETPEDDFSLFQQETMGIKKLPQDSIIPPPKTTASIGLHSIGNSQKKNNVPQKINQRTLSETQNNEFYFSDEFVPLLQEGATRYLREDVASHELKRLRRGDYIPEVFLDLHGMTQAQAKRELAALITYCINENVACASVMHGYGKMILKEKVPAWLAQHPSIMAFHQAPLEFGGQSALLVLFSIID